MPVATATTSSFLPTIRNKRIVCALENGAADIGLPAAAGNFHIVLRRDASEMDLPEDGAPGISLLFARNACTAVPGGQNAFPILLRHDATLRTRLHVTDNRLALEEFTTSTPFPFPNPDPRSREPRRNGRPAPRSSLVYLGGARLEKGFHLIPRCHATFCEKTHRKEILWRLQAPAMTGRLGKNRK